MQMYNERKVFSWRGTFKIWLSEYAKFIKTIENKPYTKTDRTTYGKNLMIKTRGGVVMVESSNDEQRSVVY